MEEENKSSKYLRLIDDQLIQIGRTSWANQDQDRIKLLKMDIGIVQMVFECIAVWKARIDDEQSKESFERCVLTPLKLIWPKNFTLLSRDLEPTGESTDTRPIDFDSVMSELEAMILQSKQQVEGWCRSSMMHSSSIPEDSTLLSLDLERMDESSEITPPIEFDSAMSELAWILLRSKQQVEDRCRNSMQHSSSSSSSVLRYCKYSIFEDFSQIVSLVEDIQEKLIILSSYRTGKITPLIKQIDILRAKLEFLRENWLLVLLCGAKYIPPFVIFIGHYANSVACFTFLYWANDHDKTDVVLFYMLRKRIPYAYDITLSYIGIYKSVDLFHSRSSDSFRLNEVVESFVDFFFEPLATVLKDDFPFLRDRLMFLFTFIADSSPPCETIRSQIHAILHGDAYLLLSFDEINKDLCDNKSLLIGFMTRIDLVNADIRQLYRGGSSASQIILEVEKIEYDYLASVHKELSSIELHVEGADKEQLRLYKMDLRFLRLFLLWLTTWDDNDEEIKVNLAFSFREIWGEKEGEGLLAHRLHEIRTEGSVTDWHSLAVELQGKIHQSKRETEAWCVNLFHSTMRFKTSTTSYKILEFLASILSNLNDLVVYKASDIVPIFQKQIQTLEEKSNFLMNFLKLSVVNCKESEELEGFKMFVQTFAKDAACFTFLYWAKDDTNDESAFETNLILSHMLQKIKPDSPEIAGFYFGALMAICGQRSDDSLMFSHTAFRFVQLFLEDLQGTHLKDDDYRVLQDNIVFLLTFLHDPPNQNAEDSICSQIDVLFWEGLYGLTPFDDMERSRSSYSNKNLLLSEFMTKIEDINANIRSLYGIFPDSSLYNFPTVISPNFLDFLLQNLENLKDRMNSDRKYAPFAKYKIIKVEEEVASLRPFFNRIFDLQSGLKETWLDVVNILHLTEHVVMSCISSWFIFDHPIWYHMAYLSSLIDEIKAVKTKLEMIELDNIMHNTRYLPGSVGLNSEINEIVVGFEDEKETIIGMLMRGPKSLDVVSIVGMGGLGKTTLAKKVYGSSLVKCHFDVFAFCSISLDHNTRRLLHDIIRDIEKVDNISRDMTKDDLAHRLRKCLSGRKYLVVLDDIWDESAWNEVKNAFPDNQNGSRVMFTTRSREVADKCRVKCIPHQLRFLSEDESWELLQKKVFRNGISPPYLYEIGKQIAYSCKGLALAVVVIGGLLARTEKNLRWWSEVSQRLAYYLSTEGCMDILELSYKHLPGKLKPCLLYLGAFPEDSLIRVKHVIMLWIAEGFIQESNTKSLEDVAKEYFRDLVDRSFVIVTTRSSNGGIKTFQVHDLIHELCRSKCRADNFFLVNHKNASSGSLEPSINSHYRVSIENISDVCGSSLSNARTVHFFCEAGNGGFKDILLRKLRLVQVLGSEPLGSVWEINDIKHLTSLIHLRYMDANVTFWNGTSLPSSISNLWNITSLKLRLDDFGATRLPETFWRMNSLRHVKVVNCILTFPDDNEDNHFVMDKVVSFSKPVLSTGKDIKRVLQKLPVVRKLSCVLKKSRVYNAEEESIETLDFYRELESLVLFYRWDISKRREYTINYPSTLKKLTLEQFLLHWTDLSAIAELHCLEVLKLGLVSLMEPTLETEDLVFPSLKFFGLSAISLEEWNASSESFPCLEKLEINCAKLKGLPSCFGEISTLKRIFVIYSPETEGSARKIQEDLIDLGIQLQLSILAKN